MSAEYDAAVEIREAIMGLTDAIETWGKELVTALLACREQLQAISTSTRPLSQPALPFATADPDADVRLELPPAAPALPVIDYVDRPPPA